MKKGAHGDDDQLRRLEGIEDDGEEEEEEEEGLVGEEEEEEEEKNHQRSIGCSDGFRINSSKVSSSNFKNSSSSSSSSSMTGEQRRGIRRRKRRQRLPAVPLSSASSSSPHSFTMGGSSGIGAAMLQKTEKEVIIDRRRFGIQLVSLLGLLLTGWVLMLLV
jgi:hypothetical protein